MISNNLRPLPVLLDCDTGIDDAIALIYLAALHHKGDIILTGVSTSAGNVSAQQCAWNSRYILDLCELATIPVSQGSMNPLVVPLVTTPETHGESGLGYVQVTETMLTSTPHNNWQELWTQVLSTTPQAHLIVTGPTTNLARWMETHGLPHNVSIMGGSFLYPGNTTPTAEWNCWVDPHAAQKVFQAAHSAHPLRLCSLSVTEKMLITPEDVTRLRAIFSDHILAELIDDALRFYFEFHEQQGEGYQAQIHDLLTCMIALGRVKTHVRRVTVDVETESTLMRGTTVADYKNHWDSAASHRDSVALVIDVDFEQAYADFFNAMQFLASHLASK
ncbi:nucleoside hydrolase [Corynebacterium sp. sy039]|uniref:nucleoside hydrolase n=1 Tax=Corynebacterium sp. sy039 TaxID=2599641 RepID=UPI001FEDBD44|nr:nucleoside hydrolase [Corynebacterium sp. sy039]